MVLSLGKSLKPKIDEVVEIGPKDCEGVKVENQKREEVIQGTKL